MYNHRRKVRCFLIKEGATHRAFWIRRIGAWVAPSVNGGWVILDREEGTTRDGFDRAFLVFLVQRREGAAGSWPDGEGTLGSSFPNHEARTSRI
jgi:hypothetical protein